MKYLEVKNDRSGLIRQIDNISTLDQSSNLLQKRSKSDNKNQNKPEK